MSEAGSMRAYDNDEHLRLPSPGRVPAILTHSALAVNNLQGIISGKEIVEWVRLSGSILQRHPC